MSPFDPAINYGPNDAGVSAVAIFLVFLSLIGLSWLFGAAYGVLSSFLNNRKESKGNPDKK